MMRQSRTPVILAITSPCFSIMHIILLFSEKTESAKTLLVRRFYGDKMERYVRSSNATEGESVIFLVAKRGGPLRKIFLDFHVYDKRLGKQKFLRPESGYYRAL